MMDVNSMSQRDGEDALLGKQLSDRDIAVIEAKIVAERIIAAARDGRLLFMHSLYVDGVTTLDIRYREPK